MGNLQHYRVKLIGRADIAVSLLAENALIAIYRAATLALEAGAADFEIAPRHLAVR